MGTTLSPEAMSETRASSTLGRRAVAGGQAPGMGPFHPVVGPGDVFSYRGWRVSIKDRCETLLAARGMVPAVVHARG